MLKILAIALLAAGCAALIAGVAIFIVTGGMNLLKEIRQAKNISFDYSTQNTASDIYYNKADNTFKEAKKKAVFNKVNENDSDPKDHGLVSHTGSEEMNFSVDDMVVEQSQSGDMIMQTSPLSDDSGPGTAPLSSSSEAEDNTAPLVNTADGQQMNTAPLMSSDIQIPVSEENPTSPLGAEPGAQMKDDTMPQFTEEKDTAPLLGERDTAPLTDTKNTPEGDEEFRDAVYDESMTQPLDKLEDIFEEEKALQKKDVAKTEKAGKWQTAPLISEDEEKVQTRDTAPLNDAESLFRESNTAPLEQKYEEVIDEISEIKSKREDDVFVDFEELFKEN